MFAARLSKLSSNVGLSTLNLSKNFCKPATFARAHARSYSIHTHVVPSTSHAKLHLMSAHKLHRCEHTDAKDTDNSEQMQHKNNILQGDLSILMLCLGISMLLKELYDKPAPKASTDVDASKALKATTDAEAPEAPETPNAEVILDVKTHVLLMQTIFNSSDHKLQMFLKDQFVPSKHIPITFGIPIQIVVPIEHPYIGINVPNVNVTFFQGYFVINYKFLCDPNLHLTSATIDKFQAAIVQNLNDHQERNRLIKFNEDNSPTSCNLSLKLNDASNVINFEIKISDDRIFCYPKRKK